MSEIVPLILGTGKAKLRTSNLASTFTGSIRKKPLKILEKSERGRIQELPKFLMYPLLSQERVKLWTSNLAGAFTGSIRNFGEKGAWAYPGAAQSFKVPTIQTTAGLSKSVIFNVFLLAVFWGNFTHDIYI